MPHVLLATLVFSASAIFATPIGVANTRVVRSLDLSKNRIRTADYSLKAERFRVFSAGSPEFAFTANGRRYTGIDSWRELAEKGFAVTLPAACDGEIDVVQRIRR